MLPNQTFHTLQTSPVMGAAERTINLPPPPCTWTSTGVYPKAQPCPAPHFNQNQHFPSLFPHPGQSQAAYPQHTHNYMTKITAPPPAQVHPVAEGVWFLFVCFFPAETLLSQTDAYQGTSTFFLRHPWIWVPEGANTIISLGSFPSQRVSRQRSEHSLCAQLGARRAFQR